MNKTKKQINQFFSRRNTKLIKILLDPNSQKITQKNTQQTQRINNQYQIFYFDQQELQLQEKLRLYTHQKYPLDQQTKNKLIQMHNNDQITSNCHQSFILLLSNAYFNKLNNPHYYSLLVKNKHLYPERFFQTIEKDICRTFLKVKEDSIKLRNILSCYAIRNPNLLYCQGNNVVVGFLINSKFSQQESFWILTSLIEEILPPDYYVGLSSIISLNLLFNLILKQSLPNFLEMCRELNLQTSTFFIKWLVCIFTQGFNERLSQYILQLIVIWKQFALIKTAICLIKIIFSKLKNKIHLQDVINQMQKISSSIDVNQFKVIYKATYINQYLFKILFVNLRNKYEHQYITKQKIKEIQQKNKQSFPQCSEQYPICLHITQINKNLKGAIHVQTIKIKNDLEDEYQINYFNQSSRVIMNRKNEFKIKNSINEIMIGRHQHICKNKSKSKMKQKKKQQNIKKNKKQSSSVRSKIKKKEIQSNERIQNEISTLRGTGEKISLSEEGEKNNYTLQLQDNENIFSKISEGKQIQSFSELTKFIKVSKEIVQQFNILTQ